MEKIIIKQNYFLNHDITAYYHTNFYGSKNFNENPNYLYKFKNDPHHNWSEGQLSFAVNQLKEVLRTDLQNILNQSVLHSLTVCVVPRAKADKTYNANQLLFKSTVKSIVNEISGLEDGTDYLIRHTNTKTTHLRKRIEGFENDGRTPYKGITAQTCHISNNISGKNILLIDDIYTFSVNIDEDAIQTFLNKGANTVIFYAVGRTV